MELHWDGCAINGASPSSFRFTFSFFLSYPLTWLIGNSTSAEQIDTVLLEFENRIKQADMSSHMKAYISFHIQAHISSQIQAEISSPILADISAHIRIDRISDISFYIGTDILADIRTDLLTDISTDISAKPGLALK